MWAERSARRARAGAAFAAVAVTALLLSACGNNGQSTLHTESPAAHAIRTAWWWMLVAAVIVFAGTMGFIGIAVVLRRREGAPFIGQDEGRIRLLVVLFGIAIPIVVLIAVFTVTNFALASKTAAPIPSSTKMTIQVIGRQWWWEIRYPGTGAVTANEIHIPARTRVNVVATTADVIHSFWVPSLNRKIDMIPGRLNRVLLYANKPGRYRGQCAEYCGPQHAHMALYVFAQEPAEFQKWLAQQEATATPPTTAEAKQGQQVFLSNACANCHQIRGTSAAGRVGPDLTHLASRTTLAGLTIANRPKELLEWIRDPQHIKPGNRMPGLNLSSTDRQAIVTYLDGLH